jgi:hypothetical protein
VLTDSAVPEDVVDAAARLYFPRVTPLAGRHADSVDRCAFKSVLFQERELSDG